MTVEIPDKLYFKIGEVGKLAGVPTHVLRYWESEFKAIKPRRASSKQRLYRREDVILILKIKTLLHEEGYTIAGARKLLEGREGADNMTAIPAKAAKKAEELLVSVKEELQHLKRFIHRNH